MSHTLSPMGEAEYAAARLDAYVAELEKLKEIWGDLPLDREAHLTAWAKARDSVDKGKFA